MKRCCEIHAAGLLLALSLLPRMGCAADDAAYAAALQKFRETPEIAAMLGESYGYALFPSAGRAGIVFFGGSYGNGRVYVGSRRVANAKFGQFAIGPQIGGSAFSQIVLFRSKSAFDAFAAGKFAFGAELSAVGINAGAQLQTTTAGNSRTASDPSPGGSAAGQWAGDTVIFVYAKAGLLLAASLGVQTFDYQLPDEGA
jgi:lipid-binding SYLF domain-containing protein